jgi:hypothetical protein
MHRRLAFLAFLVAAALPASAQYCAVANTFGECGQDESIFTVNVGSFSHSSLCLETDYEDLTALPPIPIVANASVPVSVTIANFFTSDRVTLWIDVNDDQTFGAGEDFDLPDSTVVGTGGFSATVSGTLLVAGAFCQPITVRMRVALGYSTADPQPPCGTQSYGYWKDFRVTISSPPGDCCDNPVVIGGGVSQLSSVGATADQGGVCGAPAPNIWCSFTAGLPGLYQFALQNAGPPAVVRSINTGGCAGTASANCFSGPVVNATLQSGVPYLIQLADFPAAGSPFQLTITMIGTPANDECSGAVPIGVGTLPHILTGTATTSAAPCSGMGKDVWFSYTATCSQTTFTTCGVNGFDTVLALYESCGGAPILCDDDTCGSGSSLSVATVAGQTYYLRLGGWFSNTGSTSLIVSAPFHAGFATPSPGELSLCVDSGTPFAPCFVAITAFQGNFPNGQFFGIDIPLTDVLTQLLAGPPFVSLLDGAGDVLHGPFTGLPSGLTLYGVALENFATTAYRVSAPFTATVQ